MFRMAFVTVLVMLLLHWIEQNGVEGVRIGRKKIDVIHDGKPLQDLVILNSRVAPHDLDNLNAFVKPKLLEDSRDEGMMLQENGIEDFRPLDVSLETDGDLYADEKYSNREDQISVSDSSKDGGYDLRDMPEYNVETKADFKGNQEAIDWLMKDPNDFNVKSFEDSSVLGDADSFSQNRYSTHKANQENNAYSNFHHRNDGRKRHHGPVKDSTASFVQESNSPPVLDYDQDEDDPTNHINAQISKHLAKTAKWKDKYVNLQHSDFPEYDNMDQGQKSWDGISDAFEDNTIDDKPYEEYENSEKHDEQRPRVSSMRNLNQQIENQDSKLYKELDNFVNIDNDENVDDTDNLGNSEVQSNDFENFGRKYQDLDDDEEEFNSYGEENYSVFNGNQRKGNRGRNGERKDDESTHTYNASDNDYPDTDSNDEMNSESGSGEVSEKESNKVVQNEKNDEGNISDEEKSNANGIKTGQKIANIKSNHANGNDKLKGLKDHRMHNARDNQVIQNTHILKSQDYSIDKGQDDRITNQGKASQTISHTNKEEFDKTLDETSIKHIPTDDVGHDEKIYSSSSKIDSVKKPRHRETKFIQNSNSDTRPVIVSVPKVLDEIGKGTVKNTGEETLDAEHKTRSHDSDKQQLVYQKVEGYRKVEQKPGRKPTLKGKIQLHNSQTLDYGNGEKPTSTGFRRNQQIIDPLTDIYSLGDLKKIENIISYLRGTGATRSGPTKSSRYTPTSVSLKNLYYYPVHPTPQDQNDDTRREKDVSFSEWNDWSTCSVTCGKGTSVRARVCLVTTCSQKDLLQTKTCRKRFCQDEVERESLEEHNKFRAKHFSPPLSWSVPLARRAKKIAQSLAAKDFLTLDDLREPQGESVAQILYTGESTAKKAIDKWYSEIQSYSFPYPKINDKTRHFVQIVWKETKKLGLAVAKSVNGEYAFVVALYDPPISSEGHLRQNILRPGFKLDLYATFKRGKRLANIK